MYAGELSENEPLRSSLRQALEQGLPCIAECGGFQYLQQALEGEDGALYPMVGFLKGKSFRTSGLRRFGYVNLTARKDNLLCRAGEGFAAHEFHYWDSELTGDGFVAQKAAAQVALGLRCLRRTFLGRLSPSVFLQQSADGEELLNRCEQYHRQKEGI